jgi:secondary thiamine-phosphate synthase enzyme
MMFRRTLSLPARGRGLHLITQAVAGVVKESGIADGLCSLFIQHTSASLLITERVDPAVRRDLEGWIGRVAPESPNYEHDDEGPDDMPAHLRAALTPISETIPVERGALLLGTWQGIYLWEHRAAPHTRSLVVTVLGE